MARRRCECGKAAPSLALPGEKRAIWCKKCPTKPAEAVNPRYTKCKCGRGTASRCHADDQQKKALWCLKCPTKPENTVNVRDRRCECGKAVPNYVPAGSKSRRAIWCLQCPAKPEDAINTKARKCDCGKSQPTLGLPGAERATWCAKCPSKPAEAINVVVLRCKCGKALATFGPEGDERPTWCIKCPAKPAEAVDVRSQKCECGRSQPHFGLPGDRQAKWCSRCPTKPAEAIDVKHARCECGQYQPNFGLPDDGQAKWCSRCPTKPAEAVDVKSARCECGRVSPSLGLPGDKRPRWCAKCPTKPAEAENVTAKRCLLCPTIVSPGQRATEVVRRLPQQLDAAVYAAAKAVHFLVPESHCLRCFVHMFPDEPVARNFKTKERTFVDHLRERLLNDAEAGVDATQLTLDKTVGGCSRRRPDMMVDRFTHVVFVQIDEESHSGEKYCACENKRMMELFEDVGSWPVVFIRVNPDGYTTAKGEKRPSCFKYNARGLSVVRNEEDLATGLEVAYNRLKHHVTTIPDRDVSVEHLCYDGFH